MKKCSGCKEWKLRKRAERDARRNDAAATELPKRRDAPQVRPLPTNCQNAETQPVTFAAIDIGSNAARLLIKELRPHEELLHNRLFKVQLLRVPLRLGFDVFAGGEVSPDKAREMVRLMKAYRQLMKIYHVTAYRACATSAMRDAANGEALIRRIRRETGIDIEIITGQEEARIVFDNHRERLSETECEGNYVYVDVGGGSTEVNLMTQGALVRSLSFNIGTVRILSGKVDHQAFRRMADELRELARGYPDINIIGSGGNIIKLYRLSPQKDKALSRMPVQSLRELLDLLRPLTPEQRMEQFSLKADRADVIVPAAEIFLAVADAVGAQWVEVPVIGLADGIIDGLYRHYQQSANENRASGKPTDFTQGE